MADADSKQAASASEAAKRSRAKVLIDAWGGGLISGRNVELDVRCYDLAHIFLGRAASIVDLVGELASARHVDALRPNTLQSCMLMLDALLTDAGELLNGGPVDPPGPVGRGGGAQQIVGEIETPATLANEYVDGLLKSPESVMLSEYFDDVRRRFHDDASSWELFAETLEERIVALLPKREASPGGIEAIEALKRVERMAVDGEANISRVAREAIRAAGG